MKELLKKYDSVKVNVFCKYVTKLKTDKKDSQLVNWWAKDISKEDYAHLFEKVHAEGLWLDGETISINYRKNTGLVLNFGYQAYKNKVKLVYPETIFDLQLVINGDKFNIEKKSGKVIYSHEIKNPFLKPEQNNITGGYCIIKNNTGEFFESMGIKEIEQCKKTSTMPHIWKVWYGQMAKKTVIKRGCKHHFDDICGGIEQLDNVGYDVDLVNDDTVDRPLELFKELVEARKDKEDLIEKFTNLETSQEKRDLYGDISKEIENDNS